MRVFPNLFLFIFSLTLVFQGKCIFYNYKEWRDLQGDANVMPLELVYWTVGAVGSQNISVCSNRAFLGGYGILKGNGESSRMIYYGLPPHDTIYFAIYFLILDYWTGQDYFSLMFDSIEIKFQNFVNDFNDFRTDACGEVNRRGFEMRIIGKVPHNRSFVIFRVFSHLDGLPTVKSFGLRDISLLFSGNNRSESQEICAFTTTPLLNNYACPCNSSQYKASDGSCQPCHANCALCFGPSSSECYQCTVGKYFNGTDCVTCHSSCWICFDTTNDTCLYCLAPRFLLDFKCIDPCNPPLIATTSPARKCTYNCTSNQFLYSDGSCHDSCPFPLRSYINYTKQFCESPCSNTSHLYYNGSCLPDSCSYPLKFNNRGPFEFCDLPCNSSDLLFSNGSCLSPSSCLFPMTLRLYGAIYVCELPCSPSDFIYWNNTCHPNCPSNFKQETINNFKFCNPPKCGTQTCKVCQTNGDCPYGYYCSKTDGEGICLSYTTYVLRPELMKTILNGYIIRVEVVPSLDISNRNGYKDILKMNVSSLQNNLDYKAEIKQISFGIFEVQLEILKPLEFAKILINFDYSSLDLDLKAELSVPKIIYVSSGLQKAAKVAEVGSYASFGILVVNIIGYVMTGGLSAVWAFLPENQYAYYLLYLNIEYPHHTKVYFRSLANYNMLFEGSEKSVTVNSEVKRSMPARFVDEDYPINFFDNAGQTVLMILVLMIFLSVVLFLFKCLALPRRSYLAHKLLKVIRRILKWNGILRQFIAYSLPLALAAFMQIHVAIFGREIFLVATISAIMTLVFLLLSFMKTHKIIKRIPTDSYEIIVYSEWYGTLWEGLEITQHARYYYWILALRGVTLAYVSVFFELYPYLQIFILIICQLVVVRLFLKRFKIQQIFNNKALNLVTMTEEILLLAMKVIILIFIVLNKRILDDGSVLILGWVMVAPKIIAQITQSIYGIIVQFVERKKILGKIKEGLKNICKKKSKISKKVKRYPHQQRGI